MVGYYYYDAKPGADIQKLAGPFENTMTLVADLYKAYNKKDTPVVEVLMIVVDTPDCIPLVYHYAYLRIKDDVERWGLSHEKEIPEEDIRVAKLFLTLAPDEYNALAELAKRDLRSTNDEVRMIVRLHLQREKLLPATPYGRVQEPEPKPEPEKDW